MRTLLFALLLLPAVASAAPQVVGEVEGDPCDDFQFGLGTGPVRAAMEEGGLGRGHRACGRTEVGLGLDAQLSVHTLDFYGAIVAGGVLDGSLAIGKRAELFAAVEFLRVDMVIAPLSSSAIGLGHTTLGGSWRFLAGKSYTLAVAGRAVLPTAVPLYHNAWPFGFDAALAGEFALVPGVHAHASLGVMTSFAAGSGPALPRVGGSFVGGVELRPDASFAFVLDAHAIVGYKSVLDAFSLDPGLRFSDGKRFGFSIGATIPVAGSERAQVALNLRATLRLGPIVPQPVPELPKPGAKKAE